MPPPKIVSQALVDWFAYPQVDLYCQTATVGSGQPHIRTMKLYEMTPTGDLIFLTLTDTEKWRDLQQCDQMSVCIVNVAAGQIIARGAAETIAGGTQAARLIPYWDQMPDPIKSLYRSHAGASSAAIPSSFGVIVLHPRHWEVLTLCLEDYQKSSRIVFSLRGESWVQSQAVPV